MPGHNPRAVPTISLATEKAINAACERFEEAWKTGPRARIEDFVDGWTEPSWSALLSELIALELELRRNRGEAPDRREYAERFPRAAELVTAAFAAADAASMGGLETVIPGRGPQGETADGDRPQTSRPTSFGDYELLEEIARGGMGVVYKARQRSLNRLVALKMCLAGEFSSVDERTRFRLEAELAANLDHPNIVPIYEVGEYAGRPFFSMKLVDGGSLARDLPRLLDDPIAAARLLATIARAVHFAHRRGFVHCDLKPANILLDAQGHPHVTDFGLARRFESDSALTASGALMGTPSYMAPEQASGARKELTPAADVYGLGAILYELLTGRPPFRAPTVMETVVLVLEREPESPRSLRSNIPPELAQICLKCLEKAPAERYPAAEALAETLEQFLRGESVAGTTPWQRLRRWTRREPELVSRLGGLSLMIALTQYNYLTSTQPRFGMHYKIQAVFVLWAVASLLFQVLLRRACFPELARLAWSATDMLALTSVLYIIDGLGSTLIVGYPLLIAASGLWFRVRLVWFTTGLAIAAYCGLYLDSYLRKAPGWDKWEYPNIFLAALAVTGFVVARQVKRFWALSRYYENR